MVISFLLASVEMCLASGSSIAVHSFDFLKKKFCCSFSNRTYFVSTKKETLLSWYIFSNPKKKIRYLRTQLYSVHLNRICFNTICFLGLFHIWVEFSRTKLLQVKILSSNRWFFVDRLENTFFLHYECYHFKLKQVYSFSFN